MPFAVVGSNTLIEICGKKVRGRLYPWGVVGGNKILLKTPAWEASGTSAYLKLGELTILQLCLVS